MKSLTDIYDKMISEGSLQDDRGQRLILEELEKVNYAISRRKAKSLFFKNTDNVKGIYIWGGVGCGKSMLMDLFVKNLSVSNRRVHFHAFMQEIHTSLHKARGLGKKDPLAVVANKVIKNFKVIALDEMQIKDITDAMIVGRLFTLLLDGGVKVITTSNRIPSDLYKDGLNRQLFLPFIDLIEKQLNILKKINDNDRLYALVINDYDLDYEDVDSSNDLTSLNGEWTDTFNRIAGDQYHLPNIFLGEYVYGWWILDIDGDQIADGTDPTNWDTDGDWLNDHFEIEDDLLDGIRGNSGSPIRYDDRST